MSAHLLISGHIQDVGFRYFVKSNSLKRGLKGWVTNTKDGKVEALLIGDKAKIEEMIMLCHKGPFFAQVKNVEVDWKENDPPDIIDFQVIK